MKFITAQLIIALALLAGCSASRYNEANSMGVEVGDRNSTNYRLEEPTLTTVKTAAVQAAPQPTPQITNPVTNQNEFQRKIIRNAEFTIETRSPAEDQRKLQSIAESLGGFIITSEFQQGSRSDSSTVNIILRVPSDQFQSATEKIRALGIQVLHEKVSGKDVTEEYVDLEARLRAKQALESQFLEIMKQARKVEDALSVQQQLSEVRTEIEQLQGRRRYLDNQAALSTINITLRTPAPLVIATQTGFWASIKNSFGEGVDVTVAIVLGMIHYTIVFIPVLLLIMLPAAWLLRYAVKRYILPRFPTKPSPPPQAEAL